MYNQLSFDFLSKPETNIVITQKSGASPPPPPPAEHNHIYRSSVICTNQGYKPTVTALVWVMVRFMG